MMPHESAPAASFSRAAFVLALLVLFQGTSTAADDAADHWAFVPPVRSAVPEVSVPKWTRGAIDRFVLAALDRASLRPSPEADRRTLARRVALDLTGLPPAPEAVERFVEDSQPGAYERFVDHLLGTPEYGERWALWWLDAVRFADTQGYEIDRPRSIWLYRDWVIDAFNRDLPFDDFATEQLAGDLLPNPTLEQRIATGYHRNSFENEEGAHDWAQFRWEAVVDRVHTTATVFLGLTIACAQCHDHKYDPVSQREYWQLFAFFNNVDEPFLDVPVPDVVAERERKSAEIVRLEAGREAEFPVPGAEDVGTNAGGSSRRQYVERRFEEWRQRETAEVRRWRDLEPLRYVSKMNATISPLDDRSLLVGGDRPEIDEYRVRYRLPAGTLRAFRLEALPHPTLPRHGPGRGSVMEDGSFVLTELTATVYTGTDDAEPRPLRFAAAAATHHRGKRTVELAIDGNSLTSWHTQGAVAQEHRAVFGVQDPIAVGEGAELEVVYLMNFVHQQTLGRFRLSVTDDARALRLPPYRKAVLDALLKPPVQLADGDRRVLRDAFLAQAPELAKVNERIAKLRSEIPPLPTTLVVQERETQRETRLHTRGEYSRPAEKVGPGIPAVLQALSTETPGNRLEFARWVGSRANPLTARVVVNHLWQGFFGRGLVATTEDFGTQGERPTHPELLDWLATELVRRDWSLKELQRLIVTSAVYRQSSRRADDRGDPENRLLSRGPRHRLSGEAIRDLALVTSGLLTRQIGGPSVFPPRPDRNTGFTFGGLRWPTGEGAQRYRRGLYTHRKRSSPYPQLATFDAPPRTTCTVRRMRSNTPLQALALLNDECVIEAARALAKRVLIVAERTDHERLTEAFQICTARRPDATELDALLEFLQDVRVRIANQELDANALAGIEKDAASRVPNRVGDLAAWTVTARALLNLDETITNE